jgi:hypothetical protein
MGRRLLTGKPSGALVSLALVTGALGSFSLGADGIAGADSPQTVCGPMTTLTPSASPTVTAEPLTVPQFNGSGLTGIKLSLKISHTFGPQIATTSGIPQYMAAGSGDNVLVEMSGPGLPALSPYINTAPTNNAGFVYLGGLFSTGDQVPTVPTGLVASANSDAVSAETGSGQIDPTWSGLGFGLPHIVGAPWLAAPASVVTADDSAQLNSTEQTQSVTDITDYEGTGSVSLSAAYFNAGLHSFGTGSGVSFGSTDSMSVQACATYTALVAQTPEAPFVLLLPASAAVLGAGGFVLVRRRKQLNSH